MDINNNSDVDIEQEQKGKLFRRFLSGILIGFLCSTLVLSGVYLYLNYQSKVVSSVSNGAFAGGLVNETTISKIQALESVIDTYYYKTDVDKE
ncbi:MAG: hypothetical protein J6N21_14195, partial [Butyrivibrio sp.]|nr:hypothetical protein [Butyrivibrio sp.]